MLRSFYYIRYVLLSEKTLTAQNAIFLQSTLNNEELYKQRSVLSHTPLAGICAILFMLHQMDKIC